MIPNPSSYYKPGSDHYTEKEKMRDLREKNKRKKKKRGEQCMIPFMASILA